MKQGIFWLIGILALIFGVSAYYRIITDVIRSPLSLSPYLIRDTVLAWIAIYGGFQAIKLRDIGRKLLLIYFSYQLIQIFIIILGFAYAIVSRKAPWYEIELQPLDLVSTYFLPCILSLILLLRKNLIDVFQAENNQTHIALIGKILSIVAPGLGRALVGSTWKGLLLFLVYFFLFTGFHIFGTDNMEFLQPGLSYASTILDLVVKLIIWWSFFEGDWAFVKNNVAKGPVSSPVNVLIPE